MRLKVLVVDDEPLAREGLKLLLGRQSQVESVSEARNGREAIALIREQRPDLVLLDVQMPRTDGFAVVHTVGAERMPPVIFVTAHDQYATRAFEIAALDYLLKPVTEERFEVAFKRAIGRLRDVPRDVPQEEGARQMMAMLDAIANPPRRLERFAVRHGEGTIFVPVDDVDWIEAYQNYVRLHVGPATHLLHVPMNTIEAALDSGRFLRIHRSHVVNVRKIARVSPIAHGQYLIELRSGVRLQSGRTYSEQIRRALANPF
jgi:two-component system LytT family response regulator